MENKEIQKLLDFIAQSNLDEVSIETSELKLSVKRYGATPVVQRRNAIKMPPSAPPSVLQPRLPMDDLVRKLLRLCWMVDEPTMTGKLMQLAIQLGGDGVGKLPENM